jgi:hypothetical protein
MAEKPFGAVVLAHNARVLLTLRQKGFKNRHIQCLPGARMILRVLDVWRRILGQKPRPKAMKRIYI